MEILFFAIAFGLIAAWEVSHRLLPAQWTSSVSSSEVDFDPFDEPAYKRAGVKIKLKRVRKAKASS